MNKNYLYIPFRNGASIRFLDRRDHRCVESSSKLGLYVARFRRDNCGRSEWSGFVRRRIGGNLDVYVNPNDGSLTAMGTPTATGAADTDHHRWIGKVCIRADGEHDNRVFVHVEWSTDAGNE